ncbi:MaoC/PaaZ C-terminal domain-containing protein [Xylophilus sp. GOD-11R]|uniref:MaoC/PaaZ C-terminal domain-containing protein n=1 Tax=Xylophilus sp. GOD-11R TaxID=3089814 RepID=UPI00298C8528|nr:MaoC/PaaZ C-terminal domain-containing protein [Xylophilus sp. GOD-11R]WPB55413.1 MaoC/PaaZ C-terminal domain-containing protein [Xylophilus sp. GOD-11R]
MPIDYQRLRSRRFADVVQAYGPRDCILYALGLGLGHDPMDRAQLDYVYEDGLRLLPTMAVVLGYGGFWQREADTGIAWQSVVHGEQGLRIHRPLPVSGRVTGRTVIEEIVDKGAGRGAHVHTRRDLLDTDSGELLCSLTSNAISRADGGFGGPATGPSSPPPLPDSPPDRHLDFAIPPQAALIYRLSGDDNPLHADPAVARQAGFDRPILHGLCSYGIAAYALLRMADGADPDRLRRFDVRFSAPVYPGDVLRTELWTGDGATVRFRCTVPARGVTVLDRGLAELADPRERAATA